LIVRRLGPEDAGNILRVVNDSAEAYRGVIPKEAWKEPYMDLTELSRDINDGVSMWGAEENGVICGVMGIQEKGDVTLIRHAYVASGFRRTGIGGRLLAQLMAIAGNPVLVGTWASALWAADFYEKHGFTLQSAERSAFLLSRYWEIPERQASASIVLADRRWMVSAAGTGLSG